MSDPNKKSDVTDPEIGQKLYRAVSSLGWRLPESDEEIAEAEQWVEEHPLDLPDEITDPEQALGSSRRFMKRPLRTLPNEDVVADNLARAAREGKEIPPEIEARMKKDREDAERKEDD